MRILSTFLLLLPAMAAAGTAVPAPPLPAWFEPMADGFVSRGAAGEVRIQAGGVRFRAGQEAISLRLLHANEAAVATGAEPTGATSNYFQGQLRRSGVAHYDKVRVNQVYPGIDMVYYLQGAQVEFDFVLAPGADPRQIQLAYDGATIDGHGNLTFGGKIVQHRPVAYQENGKQRRGVEAAYLMLADGSVSVALGEYDTKLPLVIDPVFYAGYLGSDRDDRAVSVAVDAAGNVWVAGSTFASVGPDDELKNVVQAQSAGLRDIYLAKLIPSTGNSLKLIYWTLIGGSGSEEPTSLALDRVGNVFVTGFTNSTDFPKYGTALQSTAGTGTEGFVLRLNPTQNGTDALNFCQTIGGTGTDVLKSIVVATDGLVSVGGYTNSTDIDGLSASGLQSNNRGGYDGLLLRMRLDSATPLQFASYLGGASTDMVETIGIDSNGVLWAAGYTQSADFPVTAGALRADLQSMFLARIDTRLSGLDALTYATFLGGTNYTQAKALAVEPAGAVWLTGYAYSTDFPVTFSAYRNVLAGGIDAFLLRFDYDQRASGQPITYASYIGGSDDDVSVGLALLPGGKVAVTGYTTSTDFPLNDTPQPVQDPTGGPYVFVTVLDPAKTGVAALDFSTTFGGSLPNTARGIFAESANRFLVVGSTLDRRLPVTDGSSKVANGQYQSFIMRVGPAGN